MNTTVILSSLHHWLRGAACRLREARRVRRELQALQRMSERELLDIGLSRADLPAMGRYESRCA